MALPPAALTARGEERPLDLCVFVDPDPAPPARGQAPWLAPAAWRALPFSHLVAGSRYAEVREAACDVYWPVALARCDCPTVEEREDGGLVFRWEDAKRVLQAVVAPGRPVLYRLAVLGQEDAATWNAVGPADQLDAVFFRLGRYMSGAKESACFPKDTPREENSSCQAQPPPATPFR